MMKRRPHMMHPRRQPTNAHPRQPPNARSVPTMRMGVTVTVVAEKVGIATIVTLIYPAAMVYSGLGASQKEFEYPFLCHWVDYACTRVSSVAIAFVCPRGQAMGAKGLHIDVKGTPVILTAPAMADWLRQR